MIFNIQSGTKSKIQLLGETSDRSICFEMESQGSNLLVLDSRPESTSNRCIVNFVGQDDSIFISPNMSYFGNFVTHEAILVSNNSHSATVAKEALVHRSIADAYRHTNETSSKGRSVNSTKG